MAFIQPKKKWAEIANAGSTTQTIAAAVTGKSYRVLSYTVSAAAACVVQFKSNTTTLNGGGLQFVGAVIAPFASGYNPDGHFQTAPGAALNCVVTGAVAVSGNLEYLEVV